MSPYRRSSMFVALALATAATLGVSRPADAQFGSLKDRIKQKAAEKAAEKVGKKVGEAMGDKPDSTQPAPPAAASATASAAAGSTAPTSRREWANYDFVPGSRTIFFTDFTEDQVGNFPKRLTFKNGQM